MFPPSASTLTGLLLQSTAPSPGPCLACHPLAQTTTLSGLGWPQPPLGSPASTGPSVLPQHSE